MLTECLTKTFSYLSQKLKSHQVKSSIFKLSKVFLTKFISNTIINFKSFIQIFREDFLCGIVSKYYANMQNQIVKLIANKSFWYII